MIFLSLALILAIGGIFGFLCKLIKLPPLIGYLVVGIVLGYFTLIDSSIINISADLRKIALVIILIKAGLSLNISELKKVGRPALLLSFVPACFEMCAIGLTGPLILNFPISNHFYSEPCLALYRQRSLCQEWSK